MSKKRAPTSLREFINQQLPVDAAADALIESYAAGRERERRPIVPPTRAFEDFRKALVEQRAFWAERGRMQISAEHLQEWRVQNIQMAAHLLAGVEAIDRELEQRQKERDEANGK